MAGKPQVEVRDRRPPMVSSELDEETMDSRRYYRWVNVKDTRIMAMRARGYEVVNRDSGVKTRFDQADDPGDGSIMHGDRVLMSISKEEKERRDREKASLRDARKRRGSTKFKEEAQKKGFKVVEGDEGEPPED